jgi:hypothetical protein
MDPVRRCAAAAVGGSGYQDGMARDRQPQVNPEPIGPRIDSCLSIHYNLLGLYSLVTRVLLGLKGPHFPNNSMNFLIDLNSILTNVSNSGCGSSDLS